MSVISIIGIRRHLESDVSQIIETSNFDDQTKKTILNWFSTNLNSKLINNVGSLIKLEPELLESFTDDEIVYQVERTILPKISDCVDSHTIYTYLGVVEKPCYE